MARVFLAYDERHERKVALKVLRPELSAALRTDRFRAEIKTAARLQHRNILPVFDSGEAEGLLYYVMPYVEGRTLTQAISESGPFPPAEVLQIAQEVATALEYAHGMGVIHRDIKPSNIMLSEGNVKILDFGIAHRDDVSLTQTGRSVGSPLYMSPEQFRGEPVDARTDLYSLGAVLHEISTGQHPVVRSSKIRPRGLRLVIERCLEQEPGDRYQSAHDVKNALARVSGTRTGRGRVAAAALLVSAVALVGLNAPGVQRLGDDIFGRTGTDGRQFVGVLPFESQGEADAMLADGLTQSLSDLVVELVNDHAATWVVPPSEVRAAEARTPADLRRIYPVDHVVTGVVRRLGRNVQIHLELVDTSRPAPTPILSAVIPGPSDPLFQQRAREVLAEFLNIQELPTQARNAEADLRASPVYRYYATGLGYLQHLYEEDNLRSAIQLFETALEEDSTYSPAYAGLCHALWESYRRAAEEALFQRAQSTCREAIELAGDEPWALVALGRMQLLTGEAERAEEALLRATALNPSDAEAHRWLGRVYESQERRQLAERSYQAAISLRPDIWLYHSELGLMYHYAARYEEAMRQHREVIRLSPNNYRGYNDLGAAQLRLDLVDEAAVSFRASIERRPNSIAYRNLGQLHIRRGRFADAVPLLSEGLQLDGQDWWSWRWLGHALHWQADTTEAQDAWRQVIALVPPRLQVNPTDQDLLCGLAEAHIALGEREEGRRYLDRLTALTATTSYNTYYAGRLYEMLGSRDAALLYVQRARQQGYDPVWIENDPWLADLRLDPRYHVEGAE